MILVNVITKIEEALEKLFQKHRIITWYDQDGEMHAEFTALTLPGVEKIILENNEFGVKYRILRQDAKFKFLLYSPQAQPANIENWLLDVQLANALFTADKYHLWLAELGLGLEYLDFIKHHEGFFNADSRRLGLKGLDIKNNSNNQLALKLMAVTLGASVDANLEDILFALLDDLAEGETIAYEKLHDYGLQSDLWQNLNNAYGYDPANPHIKDFALALFDMAFKESMGKSGRLEKAAGLLLNRWKDSQKHSASFESLSNQFARDLGISEKLQHQSISDLQGMDLFKLVDERILELLMDAVQARTISESTVSEIVRRRSATHWFKPYFESSYLAVLAASNLLQSITNLDFNIVSISAGLNKYINTYAKVDQYYRTFIYYMRKSRQSTFFNKLAKLVENQYVNNFLNPLNNNWQLVVDAHPTWEADGFYSQKQFYAQFIEPILQKDAKVAVIISDGLRYEIAAELAARVEGEGRFSTALNPLLGALPSYTQLGMAALLPHQSISIQADGNVAVDGLNTMGADNRAKVLQKALPGASRVCSDADIKGMTHEDRRALFRENKVVYVYHNQVDAAGDRDNQDNLFDAVELALSELVNLIKVLRNANFSSIIITADHGFLYQYQPLDESDFIGSEVIAGEVFSKNRRYIVGKYLERTDGLRHYQAQALGLSGDYDVLIAKGINRLRVKGSGSRYVHGGASLQEIVIPVLVVSQERTPAADIRKVNVEKISTSSNKITTGQISIKFFQVEPVSAKVQQRQLRAGIFAEDDTLLSDLHTLQFSFESEETRSREIEIKFTLSDEAEKYNRKSVFVRLEEQIPDTEKYKKYKDWQYQLDKTRFASF